MLLSPTLLPTSAPADEWEYVANVYNMSRAESVHLSLKEHGVLQAGASISNVAWHKGGHSDGKFRFTTPRLFV